MVIDYLVIGHICADLQPDGTTRLGGTALFAALTARRLGLRVAIVTACAPAFDLSALPADIEVFRQPSAQTTLFENRYTSTGRTQWLHARAAMIDLTEIPTAWKTAPIVHLAPIIDEVPHRTEVFPQALIGATPQGWLRSVAPSQLVTTDPTRLLRLPLSGIHVVVFSEEDVQGDAMVAEHIARHVSVMALTRAERGATIFVDGVPTDVPAFPATVVDPTGAGDVFAAALLIALQRGHDAIAATRWANAAAACAIEGPGATTLPTLDTIRMRIQE